MLLCWMNRIFLDSSFSDFKSILCNSCWHWCYWSNKHLWHSVRNCIRCCIIIREHLVIWWKCICINWWHLLFEVDVETAGEWSRSAVGWHFKPAAVGVAHFSVDLHSPPSSWIQTKCRWWGLGSLFCQSRWLATRRKSRWCCILLPLPLTSPCRWTYLMIEL